MGKGFKIPEVYRTGYTVIGLSIITSIAVAFLWGAGGQKRRGEKRREGRELKGKMDCGSFVYMFCWGFTAGPLSSKY